MRNVTLVLSDGTKFSGQSFGYEKAVSGEVVFNTAMIGYPECLTDPSNAGQIVVLTYPLIGNIGVPPFEKDENGVAKFFESDKIHVKALIVTDYSEAFSHWNATESLGEWLKREQIPAITGIDTRELTKTLREKGVMSGTLVFEGEEAPEAMQYDEVNLVETVSCSEVVTYNAGGSKKVVLVDCGVKNNIIRSLTRRGVEVVRVPWNYNFNELEFDGLLISNGPGNPNLVTETINNISTFLKSDKVRPCMGICLGNQLLAKAVGAEVEKMTYGHHSTNQPVRRVGTTQCYITNQNHGYAVKADTLPSDWQELFVNMNDGSNDGIKHNTNPWFAVQFHPESCNNPVKADALYDEFVNAL